jgi:phosphoribosylanthranilate isomerase
MTSDGARVRAKICGLTRVADAEAAANFGADAIGLVFAPASPRRVELGLAREIARAVGPFVTRVALFMDPSAAEVRRVLDTVEVDLLQFHGSETAAQCESFGRAYVKAIPMGGGVDVVATMALHPNARGFLLDGHGAGEAGGSGRRFDWKRAESLRTRPLILAGGLTPANVAEAIAIARPWGVDVSSGVETSPGIKDHAKMRAFIDEVRRGGST